MYEEERRDRLLSYDSYPIKRKILSILYLLLILGLSWMFSLTYADNALEFSSLMPSILRTIVADTICPDEDIDIIHRPVVGAGDHGTTVITPPFVIWNTRGCCNPDPTDGPGQDTDLDNLQILSTDLITYIDHVYYYIDADNVIFEPNVISYLESADTAVVITNVYIPLGTHSGEYKGTITVIDDDGCPKDTAGLIITVLPSYDLDIDDNGANLIDNTMNLSGKLGSVVQAIFKLINPNSQLLNADPDPFGNSKLTSLTYICSDLICGTDTMPSNLITFVNAPDTLESGEYANVAISVTIPEDQPKCLYTGTITVIDTEIVDNDTIIVSDSFILKVDAGVIIEDIDITLYAAGVGHHGTCITTSPFIVWNTDVTYNPDPSDGPGNTDLDNLQITSTKLRGCTYPLDHYILTYRMNFEPDFISYLESGDSASVRVNVCIPPGAYADCYQGVITVRDDDGYPLAITDIVITVLPSYDLDISDNEANLSANTMNLAANTGAPVQAYFSLINPNTEGLNVDPDPFGNADLTTLSYKATDLRYGNFVIPGDSVKFPGAPLTLKSGESATILTTISIPENQPKGLYTGTVTVVDTEIVDNDIVVVRDSFTLKVDAGVVLEDIDVTLYAAGIGHHGTCITTSPFIVWNTNDTNNPDASDGPGNTDLDNLQITSTKLRGCTYPLTNYILTSQLNFEPDAISYLESGDSTGVRVNVCIPLGTYADCYQGVITVRDDDGYPLAVTDIVITVLPTFDLDIADCGANLYGNTMNLTGSVEDTVQAYFSIINPNNAELNVDPDPFGNADLSSLTYSVDTLRCGDFFIPATHVSFPDAPTALESGGSANVTLIVSIPANQHKGLYTGTVTLIDTEVVNANTIVITDNFTLNVEVGVVEDIDVDPFAAVSGIGEHGTIITSSPMIIWNTNTEHNPKTDDGPGNTALDNLQITCTNLADALGHYILNKNITFEPDAIDYIESGDSALVFAKVNVPLGTYSNTYSGTILVRDDDGYPSDTLNITITVTPSYDLDISDNEASLSNNTISLSGDPGNTTSGYFILINPNTAELNVDPDPFGNAPLQDLIYESTDLTTESGIDIIDAGAISFTNNPTMLGSGASALVTLKVNIPDGQNAGTYFGTIRVMDGNTGVADSFSIRLDVNALESLAIVERSVDGAGDAGDTLITTGQFTVINIGNVDLNNIIFECTNLDGPNNYSILNNNVYFNPEFVNLPIGDTAKVTPSILVAAGQYTGEYMGTITAKDDDGYPSATLSIRIMINPSHDLDISDNEANLSANKMFLAGSTNDTLSGYFSLINPNTAELNVDPDPFGNADLTALSYESTNLVSTDELNTMQANLVSFTNNPSSLKSGASALVGVNVVIPDDAYTNTYVGKVIVTDAVAAVADSFDLAVEVSAPVIEVHEILDVVETDPVTGDGGAGDTLITVEQFTVKNVGEVDLDNIIFDCTNLSGPNNNVVLSDNIYFEPTSIGRLVIGDSRTVTPFALVNIGQYAGVYEGIITAKDDDGWPFDTINIVLTITESFDLDIADNASDLIGNAMQVAGLPGAIVESEFLLINPNNNDLNVDPDPIGNTDLTDLVYASTDLTCGTYVIPNGNVTFLNAPETLLSGNSSNIKLSVSIPANQHAGTYTGTISVGNSLVSDSFTLKVEAKCREAISVTEQIPVSDDAGNVTEVTFYVKNTGNCTITSIEVSAINDLVSASGANIPNNKIRFLPDIIDTLTSGDSAAVKLEIDIPPDMLADLYTGEIKAVDDDGSPSADAEIRLTVNSAIWLTFSDNPVRGTKVDIGYRGDPGATVSILLANMAGEIVRTIDRSMPAGKQSDKFSWDLTNNAGKSVASGTYVCLVKTKINGANEALIKKLMVVR